MPQPIIVTLSFMETAMPVACTIQDFDWEAKGIEPLL